MIELVLRIGFSLLIVLGLMWGLAKLARRPLTGHRGTGNLAVLSRQPLGRNASVAVVQVADRALVLGVTETHVTPLGETELAAFERHPHPAPERRDAVTLVPDGNGASPVQTPGHLDGSALSPHTWKAAVDVLRERTTRH